MSLGLMDTLHIYIYTDPDDMKARNSDLSLSIQTYPGSKGPPSDKKQVNSSGPSGGVKVTIFMG